MNILTKQTILSLSVLILMGVGAVSAQVSQETLDSISTPNKVETSIGTLEFLDGAPLGAAIFVADLVGLAFTPLLET